MRESCMSGSVGAPGGRLPGATRRLSGSAGRIGDAVKVAEARSDGGVLARAVEVGNDRVRALLDADQEVERIALLLGARTQDTGDDRLRRGAARRAVAPQTFRVTTAGRIACSACQLVAST